jgi:hypothetical protein
MPEEIQPKNKLRQNLFCQYCLLPAGNCCVHCNDVQIRVVLIVITSGMKIFITATILCVGICLFSCEKDASGISITGKWGITSDSLYTGVGLNNHLEVYDGKPGDYFDFSSDGHIYINESGRMDTLAYVMYPGDSILVQSFGVTYNGATLTSCHIVNLSSSNLTIQTPRVITPGGIFGRTVHLAR